MTAYLTVQPDYAGARIEDKDVVIDGNQYQSRTKDPSI